MPLFLLLYVNRSCVKYDSRKALFLSFHTLLISPNQTFAVGYLLSNVWRLTSCRFQPHCLTSVYVEMMLCIKEDSGELWLAGVLD